MSVSTPLQRFVMRAADGMPLKLKLRQARAPRAETKAVGSGRAALPVHRHKVRPADRRRCCATPFYDPDIRDKLPRRPCSCCQHWDGKDVPAKPTFAALVADLQAAQKNKTAALIGKRLNYEMPTSEIEGHRPPARKVDKIEAGPYKEALIAIDPVWGDVDTWAAIKRASQRHHAILSARRPRSASKVPTAIVAGMPPTAPSTCRSLPERSASACW